MMQLREAQLSEPVTKWLESRGCQVFAEVPMLGRIIDLIGLADNGDGKQRLIAIELKTSLTWQVMKQALTNQLFVDESYCAVGTSPRRKNVEACIEHSLGVLGVSDGHVTVWAEPAGGRPFRPYQNYRADCLELLSRSEPGGIAGQPQLAGIGPAQEVARLIDAYRVAHPKATWQEIFDNIEHHYPSMPSLVSSMGKLRDRLWHQARFRREKEEKGSVTL